MKISRQLQGIPDASAQAGASMTITRTEDGATVGTALTDSEGIATVQTNGSPGPIKTTFIKGNRWADDSRSIMPTGSMDLCELRNLIDFLHGDGVIPGYGSAFAITSSGSGNALIGTGAVVLDGVLSVHAAAETISVDDNDLAIVVKQMHSNGRTQLIAIPYSDVGSTTCVPLWRCTVSGGSIVGSPTWIATPILSHGIVHKHATVMGIKRLDSGSTTSGSGEGSELGVFITLESGVVYDVEAHASVISRGRHGSIALDIDGTLGTYQTNGGDRTVKLSNSGSKQVTGAGLTAAQAFHKSQTALTGWALGATYGSFGSGTGPNFNTPGQVALDASGNVYVADYNNSRIVKLNSSGAYVTSVAFSAPTGVAYDATHDKILGIARAGGVWAISRYTTGLVVEASTAAIAGTAHHAACDGTYVYVAVNDTIHKRNATGAMGAVTTWGSTGSGNGQFSTPYGICASGGEIYVTDQGNTRVQVFNTAGVYQRKWSTGGAGYGIAPDGSGHVLLAVANDVFRYTTAGVFVDYFVVGTLANPSGVAVTSGGVVWVSDSNLHNVTTWSIATAFTWDSGLLVVKAVPRT